MRRLVKTTALLIAAVVYIPLVLDWCMPSNGLHQAAVALGGYGPGALRPFSSFFIWDPLVRLKYDKFENTLTLKLVRTGTHDDLGLE